MFFRIPTKVDTVLIYKVSVDETQNELCLLSSHHEQACIHTSKPLLRGRLSSESETNSCDSILNLALLAEKLLNNNGRCTVC